MTADLRALDMRRLQTLERVAAHASFSQAARDLHFTQSAVSQQVAALERDVGVRLVNRNPVSLTQPGRMLCERYASALAELAAAQAELASFREGGSGRLRLAAVGAGVGHIVPRAAAMFAARFPAVVVTVQQDGASETLARLRRGDADVALTIGCEQSPSARPQLRWVRLTRERISVAVPQAHPLAHQRTVRLAELQGESFLHSPGIGIPVEALAMFTPTMVVDGENPDAVHALVAEGAGLAFVPALDVKKVPGVEHVLVTDPVLTRSMYAVVLESAIQSETVGTMLDELVISARRGSTIRRAWRADDRPRAALG